MEVTLWIISIVIWVSAIIAIIVRHREKSQLFAIFKPLTTILIIGLTIFIYWNKPSFYSLMMIPSLVFALVGDVFLLDKKYFLHGLASFLVAHIGFTIGFLSIFGYSWYSNPLIIIGLMAGWYFYYLAKDLGKYLIPVAVYIIVIVVMNWQAISLVLRDDRIVFWGLAMASLLFSFSDSIIAYKKFKLPFRYDEVLILSTYWLAVFIFAISGWFI